MSEQAFTVIDDGRPIAVAARLTDEGVWLSPEAVEAGLGWEIAPHGLCRDGLCVPLPESLLAGVADGIDLASLASLLGRPLALDIPERAAYLGVPAAERGDALASLEAPDFSLPDLDGRLRSLAEHRGKKVLLVAWASW